VSQYSTLAAHHLFALSPSFALLSAKPSFLALRRRLETRDSRLESMRAQAVDSQEQAKRTRLLLHPEIRCFRATIAMAREDSGEQKRLGLVGLPETIH
jgi:hypothetical protein